MRLLIDGYNLLNASIVAARAHGRTELERSRLGLLDFLASSLDANDLPRTCIVFDAAGAPPGLPAETEHAGMQVRFARDHACADALIEELINACTTPRDLTVVSSDHRIHRAARRRKAKVFDSDRWIADLAAGRMKHEGARRGKSAKPTAPPSPTEVEHWVERFSDPK